MNYLVTVSYFGERYYGFEKQKNHVTIQGTIEKALSTLLDEEIKIHGAGRTDRGVSAKGQTFSFKAKRVIKSHEDFLFSLNRLLPKDIFASSIKEVSPSFDARHKASGKIYSYSFHYGFRDVFAKCEYQLELPDFDFGRFAKCLKLYEGKHDFKNFTSKSSDIDNFVRDIEYIKCDDFHQHVKVTLKANGFMTYQVRIMMGVALRVGLGKMRVEEVQELLHSDKRKVATFKADPSGLVLEKVIYEE